MLKISVCTPVYLVKTHGRKNVYNFISSKMKSHHCNRNVTGIIKSIYVLLNNRICAQSRTFQLVTFLARTVKAVRKIKHYRICNRYLSGLHHARSQPRITIRVKPQGLPLHNSSNISFHNRYCIDTYSTTLFADTF